MTEISVSSDAPLAQSGAAGRDFSIVGIGASAGGLEAFEAFFRACPADTGMAFVLVPHLDPDHHSLLTEILQRCTRMPVAQALDQVQVEPDHIYIIPPNREMTILNGALQLALPDHAHGQRLPIDSFFRSLADDQAEHAIGIILSGTASDGTLGLRAILGVGGVCMVQTPATAKYDGMPQSAIKAGYATHILSPEAMPALLQELSQRRNIRLQVPRTQSADALSGINQIMLQVRNSTGHDFSLYKKSTIGRRIERRMAQHHIEDMAVYTRFLKQDPAEVHALFKDLLINVTSFFRDAEAFVILKQDILPALLADKPDDYVFRVWVAGCASGEEAYSIAIVLRELMDEAHKDFKVQIYATDLDDDAINTARSGRYPAGITQDVSPERLQRYFTRDDGGYKIKKHIREMVVFAVQSVIKDPPFTKLDLLSCRNLMIYLEPEQQARLIPNFHYALKPGGVLFLSNSESIPNHPELFSALNRKWKFYWANHTQTKASSILFGNPNMSNPNFTTPAKILVGKVPAGNVAELSNRILLQSYAPASVTTDIRRLYREHGGLGLIVIDYLQLMSSLGNKQNDTSATEISEMTRALKALAKELKVPVITLSQLNRSLEKRDDKRPLMSDLRDSGSIEQDADLILFLHREEYYSKDSNDKGKAEVIIGKHRNGPTGSISMVFISEYTRFENMARGDY